MASAEFDQIQLISVDRCQPSSHFATYSIGSCNESTWFEAFNYSMGHYVRPQVAEILVIKT